MRHSEVEVNHRYIPKRLPVCCCHQKQNAIPRYSMDTKMVELFGNKVNIISCPIVNNYDLPYIRARMPRWSKTVFHEESGFSNTNSINHLDRKEIHQKSTKSIKTAIAIRLLKVVITSCMLSKLKRSSSSLAPIRLLHPIHIYMRVTLDNENKSWF